MSESDARSVENNVSPQWASEPVTNQPVSNQLNMSAVLYGKDYHSFLASRLTAGYFESVKDTVGKGGGLRATLKVSKTLTGRGGGGGRERRATLKVSKTLGGGGGRLL